MDETQIGLCVGREVWRVHGQIGHHKYRGSSKYGERYNKRVSLLGVCSR